MGSNQEPHSWELDSGEQKKLQAIGVPETLSKELAVSDGTVSVVGVGNVLYRTRREGDVGHMGLGIKQDVEDHFTWWNIRVDDGNKAGLSGQQLEVLGLMAGLRQDEVHDYRRIPF